MCYILIELNEIKAKSTYLFLSCCYHFFILMLFCFSHSTRKIIIMYFLTVNAFYFRGISLFWLCVKQFVRVYTIFFGTTSKIDGMSCFFSLNINKKNIFFFFFYLELHQTNICSTMLFVMRSASKYSPKMSKCLHFFFSF